MALGESRGAEGLAGRARAFAMDEDIGERGLGFEKIAAEWGEPLT